jgi:hypothetical protein
MKEDNSARGGHGRTKESGGGKNATRRCGHGGVEESGGGKSVLGGWPWRGGGEWRWGRLWPLLNFSSMCPSSKDRDEVRKKEQDNVTRLLFT